MLLDRENNIIKRCAEGMANEGDPLVSAAIFRRAWDEAATDLEKFVAAHYLARHQQTVADKLAWDETALEAAQKVDDEEIKTYYPSLYLNIAKCYEDLGDTAKAKQYYQSALSFSGFLPDDGYGHMIQSGITNGIARINST